jgi:putative ABC transport system substrate-binding protein
MRRREFITLLGGAATAWPVAARAQQAAMLVVGYLSSLAQAVSVQFDASFRRGLSEMGYVEGQNVSIEYRGITDSYDPLPTMATDLVQRQVAVICALGPPAVLAAKAATAGIPIVFVTGDAVRTGPIADGRSARQRASKKDCVPGINRPVAESRAKCIGVYPSRCAGNGANGGCHGTRSARYQRH